MWEITHPPDQALIVQVIEEGRQQQSGRLQTGVEMPREFLCRLIALICGDLAEHKIHIARLHRRCSWSRQL
jgi:hypothetical protein